MVLYGSLVKQSLLFINCLDRTIKIWRLIVLITKTVIKMWFHFFHFRQSAREISPRLGHSCLVLVATSLRLDCVISCHGFMEPVLVNAFEMISPKRGDLLYESHGWNFWVCEYCTAQCFLFFCFKRRCFIFRIFPQLQTLLFSSYFARTSAKKIVEV